MKETIAIGRDIARLLLPKETEFKNSRASIKISGGKAAITAKDQPALNAAKSSIQKIILIHKKTAELVKNGREHARKNKPVEPPGAEPPGLSSSEAAVPEPADRD